VSSKKPIPTLYEWAGGEEALRRLVSTFYERVPQNPVLAPVFASMSPEHAHYVANFLTEVLGGPARYTENGGGHARMVRRHFGRMLTEEQRRAWVGQMLDIADEVGLPSDPEFRSAFVGYLEWGTRLAVINAAPGVEDPPDDSPMPVWGWGVPGGPYLP
jgi:hemoglobin